VVILERRLDRLSLLHLLITTRITAEIWTSGIDDYQAMARHNRDGRRSGLTKLRLLITKTHLWILTQLDRLLYSPLY
jgi:hypothetical protein